MSIERGKEGDGDEAVENDFADMGTWVTSMLLSDSGTGIYRI